MSTESQLNQAEYEQELKTQGDNYNSELQTLNSLQDSLQNMRNESFKILQKLYSDLTGGSQVDEREYKESLLRLDQRQLEVYEKQTECFHLLQSLRNMQNNYLVGIINGLNAQIKELQDGKSSKDNRTKDNRTKDNRTKDNRIENRKNNL